MRKTSFADQAIYSLSVWEGPGSVLRAALGYVKARVHQLAWRRLHGGGDSIQLVNATQRAFGKLQDAVQLLPYRDTKEAKELGGWPMIARTILNEDAGQKQLDTAREATR